MLAVGVPSEIKPEEKRVGLTPAGVQVLRQEGIPVLVERGAGETAGFRDEDFRQAGAEIVPKARELYRRADLIQKVKEPLDPEFDLLTHRHTLFCFLHLASPENKKLTSVLLQQGVTALGFETVEKNGQTLLLEPMSEIAGTLAAYFAAFFRQGVQAVKGKAVYPPRLKDKLKWLASQYPNVPAGLEPVKAVVYGGGSAGRRAAEILLRLGGEVVVVEKNSERQKELLRQFEPFSSRLRVWGVGGPFQEALRDADAWIGCVHLAGQRAPLVLTQEEMAGLCAKKKKFIMDIAADQGGNFPGTRSTTYRDPLFLDEFGNFRFGVTNIPSLCGRGASEALEKAVLPYTLGLARKGTRALAELAELQKGVQIYQGRLVNQSVAETHGLTWEPLKL